MNEVIELALPVIHEFEGCRLKAYLCPAHVWTIGWGETGLDVMEGAVWTQEQADTRLNLRLGQFIQGVIHRCPALLLMPPNAAAACLSLAYNIGLGAFGASSVRRLTMNGEYKRAAESFLLWNKGGGRVLNGLTLRRRTEMKLYLGA